MRFYRTTVGKKVAMAVSGFALLFFVIGHMVGNLKIFMGADPATGQPKLDIYGAFLRSVGDPLFSHGQLLWAARLGLLFFLIVHVISAFFVTRAARDARPVGYGEIDYITTNYAARTMWVSGVLLLVYVVFHLLHFTTGTLHFDGFEHGKVHANVTSAFQHGYLVLIYVVAMGALCAHIFHGLWSGLQTLGVNRRKWNRYTRNLSKAVAIALFLGYVAVPLAVYFGWVK